MQIDKKIKDDMVTWEKRQTLFLLTGNAGEGNI